MVRYEVGRKDAASERERYETRRKFLVKNGGDCPMVVEKLGYGFNWCKEWTGNRFILDRLSSIAFYRFRLSQEMKTAGETKYGFLLDSSGVSELFI